MDTPGKAPGAPGPFRPVPPLPKRVAGLWAPVIVGTTVWFAALLILLITGAESTSIWTAVAGGGLGFVGLGIIAWQTVASRQGSRAAQREL